MGNGMNKILPRLYVGNIRDAKDEKLLNEHQITHVLSIHNHAKPLLKDKKYLCLVADDNASQDLIQYFQMTNDFIHDGRVRGGGVLVHCLAGVSRSVTVTVAYIMTVTSLEWREALNAVRGARRCANPNFGFQRQLLTFQHEHLAKERERFKLQHVELTFNDEDECRKLIEAHQEWVLHGDQATENDRTYPLAHNAYGKKTENTTSKEQSNSDSVHSDVGNEGNEFDGGSCSTDLRKSNDDSQDAHCVNSEQLDDLFDCPRNSQENTSKGTTAENSSSPLTSSNLNETNDYVEELFTS